MILRRWRSFGSCRFLLNSHLMDVSPEHLFLASRFLQTGISEGGRGLETGLRVPHAQQSVKS